MTSHTTSCTRELPQSPLLRLLLPLVVGMVVGLLAPDSWLPPTGQATVWLTILLPLVTFGGYWLTQRFPYRDDWQQSFNYWILMACVLTGCWLSMQERRLQQPPLLGWLHVHEQVESSETSSEEQAPDEHPLSVHDWLRSQLAQGGFSKSNEALLAALLLGDKSEVPTHVRQAFQRTGMAHMLALSGLHISLILLLLHWLLPAALPLRKPILLGALWSYIALVGWPLSAVRAATMATLWLLHPYGKQHVLPLDIWALTALGFLLYRPSYLASLSFQLSFAAVGFILLCQPYFIYTSKLPRKLQEAAWICVTAQLGVMPFIVWYFGSVPVWFLPVNLLITPLLLPAIVYTGMGYLATSLVAPWASGWVAQVLGLLLDLQTQIIGFFDHLSV